MAGVVIVGAGHAGGSAAAFLRQFGYAAPITLIGDEPVPPYQRPPLSKAWLRGEADGHSVLLKPASWYDEHGCVLRLGETIAAIDRAAMCAKLTSGESIPYDKLILAMGARARKLPIPGADLAGVLELRSIADAEALKAAIGLGTKLAVIGGGYVGLEAAASARKLGAEVTVIEREARCLARVACEPLSSFFETCHRRHGVDFETGAEVDALIGDGHVAGVRLRDGREIACDIALVGIGALPNEELAAMAGIVCENGILVDGHARTSDPNVYAIGDVTNRPLAHYSRRFRLESVPNALEQARQASADITGHAPPAAEVPWFWSDQYDLKLQIAGIPFDCDRIVIRGDPDAAKFAVFHLQGGRVMAVEAVNAVPEFMIGRKLIASETQIDADRLADLSVSMKEISG